MPRYEQEIIEKIEQELGQTVKRLENRRLRQMEEHEALREEYIRVSEEKEELKSKLGSLQHELDLRLEEDKIQMEQWNEDRAVLERRLATAEASLHSARDNERKLMEHAVKLDEELASKRKEQSEQSTSKSKDDALQLIISDNERKVESISHKLKEMTIMNQALSDERDNLNARVESLERQLHSSRSEACEREEAIELKIQQTKKEQEELFRDRLNMAQESLSSALRLNETREKQISMMQEALAHQKAHHQHREELRQEAEGNMEDELRHLHNRCRELEELRGAEQASFQKQLSSQRDQIRALSEKVASWEEQRNRLCDQESLDRSKLFSSTTDPTIIHEVEDAVDMTCNRVVNRVLTGFINREKQPLESREGRLSSSRGVSRLGELDERLMKAGFWDPFISDNENKIESLENVPKIKHIAWKTNDVDITEDICASAQTAGHTTSRKKQSPKNRPATKSKTKPLKSRESSDSSPSESAVRRGRKSIQATKHLSHPSKQTTKKSSAVSPRRVDGLDDSIFNKKTHWRV